MLYLTSCILQYSERCQLPHFSPQYATTTVVCVVLWPFCAMGMQEQLQLMQVDYTELS